MMLLWLSLIEDEDQKAIFVEFHRRYEKKMYSIALKILQDHFLAEDAVNEAFFSIARSFPKFMEIYRRNRKEIAPWTVVIIKNAALDILRKKDPAILNFELWDIPELDTVEGENSYRKLVFLIRSMPIAYRRALELKFVCEWSDREIAKALGISTGAATQKIHRGRKLLLDKLKQEGYF